MKTLNELIKTIDRLDESASLASTLHNINHYIGAPLTQIYAELNYALNKVTDPDSFKIFKLRKAQLGSFWFQSYYFGKLSDELYQLAKYLPKEANQIRSLLDEYMHSSDKLNFGRVAATLPIPLLKTGQAIGDKTLEKNAELWRKNESQLHNRMEEIVDSFKSEDPDKKERNYKEKPEYQDNNIGQQNAQVEKIVNDVLTNLPKDMAGDIRNAIAKQGNKLLALKLELEKRGIRI